MRLRTLLAAAACGAMIFTGLATAAPYSWQAGSGLYEPNTIFDMPTHMFQAPNQAPVEKIYFNGLVIHSDNPGLTTRFDLNADGGSILSPVGTYHAAILGYWRDCNKDGYVGAKIVPATMGSFSVYPRQLVASGATTLDTTICPLGSPYNPIDASTGQPAWQIDEFRWVGTSAGWSEQEQGDYQRKCGTPAGVNIALCVATGTEDRWDVTDDGARVWSDWGYPGSRHLFEQGLSAQPRGTYSDSDHTLAYVDFALGGAFSGILGEQWEGKPNVGACDSTPVLLEGGSTCGAWPLYQAKRLLNDSNSNQGPEAQPDPIVYVFDVEKDSNGNGNPCDDFVNQTAAGRTVALPDPDVRANGNALIDGSIAGTYGNVARGTNSGQANGRCARTVLGFASLEGEGADNEVTHRAPTQNMSFAVDQRYHTFRTQGFEDLSLEAAGTRSPLGVNGVPLWYGGTTFTGRPPRTGFGSTTNAYATFYADVTNEAFVNAGLGASAATSLPAKTQNKHTYGVPEFCAAVLTGPSRVNPANDWECSATVWIAKRNTDEDPMRPVLGDAYDLRDVDCYDNSVADKHAPGVKAGIADCSAINL